MCVLFFNAEVSAGRGTRTPTPWSTRCFLEYYYIFRTVLYANKQNL